jgi:hypothetical protein
MNRARGNAVLLVRTGGALVLAAALAACSSSSPKASDSQTTTSAAAATSTASSTPTASITPGPADAATKAAVTKAYETFFDYHTPASAAGALLQDGAAFKPELATNAKLAVQQKVTVKLDTVSMVSPNTAKVTFDLLLAGKAALKGTSGFAVRENGTWKVAGQTFCALLGLNGSTPPVCTNPAAISLPN